MAKGSVPKQGSKSSKSRLTSLDLNAKMVRLEDGWEEDDRFTESLDYLI